MRFRRRRFCCLLRVLLPLVLLLIPTRVAAGVEPSVVAEHGAPGLYTSVCANGLPVVADARPGTRTVFAEIGVRVGSRQDPPGLAGLSHLLEHLLFKEGHGATRVSNPALSALRAAGALVNASTDFELTEYHADLPAGRFDEGWDALVAMVGHADFDEADVERERSVVLQEVALGKTDPLAIVAYSVLRRVYPGNPLGQPIIGRRRSLRSIRRSDLIRHYRRYYTPAGMFAVIVGDVNPTTAIGRACGTLGSEPAAGPPPPPTPPPVPDVTRLYRFRTLTSRSYLLAGALTQGEASPDAPALGLLATILGGGRTSRLYGRLVDREALGDDMLAISFTVSDAGAFGAGTAVDPENAPQARAALLEEMSRLAREAVGTEELQTARRLARGRLALQFETNAGIAAFRARCLLYGRPVDRDTFLARIDGLTPDDLLAAARRTWGETTPGPTMIEVLPARGLGKLIAALRFLIFRRI